MNGINFAFLLEKYMPGTQYIVHDRTYGGLELINGKKPPIEIFYSWQRSEDELANMRGKQQENKVSLMQEKQAQARNKALEEIRPIEDKIREKEEEIRANIFKLRQEAVAIQESHKTMDALDMAWQEISKAQGKVNHDAQKYLNDTDWYVTRKNETGIDIPDEVSKGREEARARIKHGETVYANWSTLRAKESPSRAEIQASIKAGGEELLRMKKLQQEIALRYKRPTRS